MRKKYISIVLIIALIGMFDFFEDVRGSAMWNIFYFDSDNHSYYVDEEIKLNASWELIYDTQWELTSMQVIIVHENGTKLWESPQYTDTGISQKDWIVIIQDLDIIFNESSFMFSVQFWLFYIELDTPNHWEGIIDSFQIEVIKRDVSCQLIGFPNILKHGENLFFKARFFDTLSNNSDYLINQDVECKIISNSIFWLEKNFTINSSGIIEVYLNTSEISYNMNYLIFSVKDNEYYNDSEFEYEIIMEVNDSVIIPEIDVPPIFFSIFLFPIFLLMSISMILYYKNKKSKQRKLIDITIKF